VDGEDDQEGERGGADLDVQDAASGGHVLVGGYVSTAVLSSAIGAAVAPWQAGVFRAAAWTACGLWVPARNALLADVVRAQVYGRAYGFEQAMDNLGAIGGPLLAGPLGRLLAGVGIAAALIAWAGRGLATIMKGRGRGPRRRRGVRRGAEGRGRARARGLAGRRRYRAAGRTGAVPA
jgi:MFS family permease